ncbi:MAG TPA: hypothetical protein PK961_00025 [bacterium]|nr:hypothetical protein [bacterium]
MTIPIDEKSIVKEYDRSEDFIVDAQDNEHIRIMKLFPLCHEREEIKLDDYRRFHCRFYLPRAKVLDKNNKIDRLILIINGLNEKYFTLYDQLGRGLSHYGIASVLLPLPNHLNRHTWFRHKDEKKTLDNFNPSDNFMEKPSDFFKLYLQMMHEMNSLVDHIKGKGCANDFNDACQFFDAYFEKKSEFQFWAIL